MLLVEVRFSSPSLPALTASFTLSLSLSHSLHSAGGARASASLEALFPLQWNSGVVNRLVQRPRSSLIDAIDHQFLGIQDCSSGKKNN